VRLLRFLLDIIFRISVRRRSVCCPFLWWQSYCCRVFVVVVDLSHQRRRFAYSSSNPYFEFDTFVCPSSGFDSGLPGRVFREDHSLLLSSILLLETAHLLGHPQHLLLEIVHQPPCLVVLLFRCCWLTPAYCLRSSSWLVTSWLFGPPIGSFFVSQVHVAPVFKTCTPVHGGVGGGRLFSVWGHLHLRGDAGGSRICLWYRDRS